MNDWSMVQSLFQYSYEAWIILVLTAVTCSLIGTFLVLRQLSMIADAISHTVLLGIVLGYFVAGHLDSPLLILGAAFFGLITVWATETLTETNLVESGDAIGIVFSFFFALAIILVTRFASNVHLDIDIVLTGEVILAPLNRMTVFGWSLPKAFVEMFILLIVNFAFIVVFFKELKLTTFDKAYGYLAGFNVTLLFYMIMSLVSVTTVVAFDAVGAILVIAFLIGPGATAYLICKDLKMALFVAAGYATFNATVGYFIGILFNVSIAGAAAVVTGTTFFLTFLFHREGLLTSIISRRRQAKQLKLDLVLLHIANHTEQNEELSELKVNTLDSHFNWSEAVTAQLVKKLFHQSLIKIDPQYDVYQLTSKGAQQLETIYQRYNL